MNENIDDSNKEKLANELLQKFPRYDPGLVEGAANAVYGALLNVADYAWVTEKKVRDTIEEKGSGVSLSRDFNLDSFDQVELTIELNEKGITIDDKMLKDWKAPKGPDLMDLLEMAYESKEYKRRFGRE